MGSKHVKMEKTGNRPITLPHHKGGDYPKGPRTGHTETGRAQVTPSPRRRNHDLMATTDLTYKVHVHEDDDGLWAEVEELPGCFASGHTLEELQESLIEAIGLYLSSPDSPVQVEMINPEELSGEAVESGRFTVLA